MKVLVVLNKKQKSMWSFNCQCGERYGCPGGKFQATIFSLIIASLFIGLPLLGALEGESAVGLLFTIPLAVFLIGVARSGAWEHQERVARMKTE